MTTKCILLMLLLSFYACDSATNKSNKNSIKSEEKSIDKDNTTKPYRSSYTTSTGKSIEIIESSENNSESNLILIPKGFPNSKDSISLKNIDPIQTVLIKDLDKNGFDEIYIITRNTGSGTYGNVHAFASNKDLSISPVYFPEVTEQDLEKEGSYEGYMGHDSIYIETNVLKRKFPVYRSGDANCCPTGGTKTVAYQLKPGEASWILKKVDD